MKLAEDSDALVLRLYEPYGARGRCHIELAMPFSSARRSNLLEDDLGPAATSGSAIAVDYRPWEIVTLIVA